MNFFERQDLAKRKTGLLIFYFNLSIIGIIVSVYMATIGIFYYLDYRGTKHLVDSNLIDPTFSFWDPKLFLSVVAVTVGIILIGSLYKIITIGQGGRKVAELLGGRLVPPDTKDADERKLLNIIEEMSIASGTPVPAVYVLANEYSINAFAAGTKPGNAVIGVTKGCIESLSRDELQGVIAHEFSHILNGDMRLNIRLMGILHGILILSVIGYILLRTRGRKNPLPLFGLALLIIGYVGVFFGKLIKAAVSRQREYLADASAVQFTRYPDGLSNALKKIGANQYGSRITSPNAEEASHFYFAQGLKGGFVSLMATHPPLVTRIQKIDPSFDGNFDNIKKHLDNKQRSYEQNNFTPVSKQKGFSSNKAINQIGSVSPEQLIYATALIASMPETFISNLHTLEGGLAAIYALLINNEPEIEKIQLDYLSKHEHESVNNKTKKLVPILRTLGPEYRLPIIDLTIPVLKGMSEQEFPIFKNNVNNLIQADNKVDLFEFMLQRVLIKHLELYFEKKKKKSVQYGALLQLKDECNLVLSSLAYIGDDNIENAKKAYSAAWGKLSLKKEMLEILPKEKVLLEEVGIALDKLALTEMNLKKNIIEACVTCVAFDEKVTVEEGELIRAICATFDLPMPPIL